MFFKSCPDTHNAAECTCALPHTHGLRECKGFRGEADPGFADPAWEEQASRAAQRSWLPPRPWPAKAEVREAWTVMDCAGRIRVDSGSMVEGRPLRAVLETPAVVRAQPCRGLPGPTGPGRGSCSDPEGSCPGQGALAHSCAGCLSLPLYPVSSGVVFR